ncbi:transporter substrate-binding domain-containing protein [Serratia fonticola]
MYKYMFLLIIFLLCSTIHSQASMFLLPLHSDYAANIVKLNKADEEWLTNKGALIVGVYGPFRPPMSLVKDPNTLSGIISEYILMLKETLKINVTIKKFHTREKALAAIIRGEVDLVLPPLSIKNETDNSLALSKPLIYSYPSLISRKTDSMRLLHTDDDVTVAVTGDYPDRDFILKLFKNPNIIVFNDTYEALSSVDDGGSDFYIGDNIEAGYFLFFYFENSLNMIKVWDYEKLTLSFVISKRSPELLHIINLFVDSITPKIHQKIVESWIGVGNMPLYSGPSLLTDKEKKWVEKHKKTRIIINPYYLPFTMVDSNLDVRGIIGDILDFAHIKTGLDFEPVIARSNNDVAEIINKGDWDLHPAAVYSDERNEKVIFTKPFMSTPFVIVVKEDGNNTPDIKKGMTIAIPSHHTLMSTLKNKYPEVRFLKVSNSSVAINMLTRGKVDAAISTKLTAKYYMDHYNSSEYHYYTIPGVADAEIAFALPNNAYELRDILNKVLENIPQEQVSRLSNKWLSMPNIQVETWDLYKNEFYLTILFSTLLIVISLLWGMYLLKQTRLRKDSERSLEEQLNFSSTLSSSIPLPLYVITLNGELTRFNPAYSSFFVKEIQPKIGDYISNSNNPLNCIFNKMQRDLEHGFIKENIFLYNARINNGSEVRDVTHWFTLFKSRESTPPLLICGWIDITESKNLTDALIIETAKANDAKQAKGAFLTRMSHELRTPVSAIIGFLELIRLENNNQDIKDSNIELAYTTGQSLLNLIGDILDIEKIDSGKFDIHHEWVDFGSLLSSNINMFDALVFKKGLGMFVKNYISDNYHLWLDPQAMRQILSNVIGNAVKFTEQGEIDITANLNLKDHDAALLVINVKDSGPGIPVNEQGGLFQPFNQTSSGKFKIGSGLGLSICHEIISLMDGRIFISKSTSQGTTFTIEIPTKLSAVASSYISNYSENSITTISDNKLNVLIVDDNPINLLLISRQLGELGHSVDEATNANNALDTLNRKMYDLLITDINMPDLDGVELTQKIRTFDIDIPIWGLTANASQQERERCLAAGLNLLLFKPLSLQNLATLLQKVKPRVTKVALRSMIDMNALYSLTMGEPALISQILSHAKNESEIDLLGIQHALASHDPVSAKHALHRLTGTLQILRAEEIVKCCETLMRNLQDDSKGVSIQSELDMLTLQVTQLCSLIDRFMNRHGS